MTAFLSRTRTRRTVVQRRTARSSGATVAVIDNRDQEFMDDDLPWCTVCETHGRLVGHDTRSLAISWASAPEEWCNDGDSCCRMDVETSR